jgi:hypothetical protein
VEIGVESPHMKLNIPKNENSAKPANYYFITDLSGSMYGAQAQLRETLKQVKNLLGPNDTFSLAYFSSYGDFDWICKGVTRITSGLDNLIDKKIYVRGLTCFTQVLDSLKTTVADISQVFDNNDNVLFFLTDGYPNDRSPETEVRRISKELKNLFTEKRIVGYSSYYNRRLLIDMAEDMGGIFNHISDFMEMRQSAESIVSNKKSFIKIILPASYDIVWQVTDNDVYPVEVKDGVAYAVSTDKSGELYAANFDEIYKIPSEHLSSPKFVYSYAYMLSQKNKANLGVALLKNAGDHSTAKTLRKAFTVLQKGKVENMLKNIATTAAEVVQQPEFSGETLSEFVKRIKNGLGKISIDMNASIYNSISRKGTDVSKVKFNITDSIARIVGITGNENRANLSFLTSRQGDIVEIVDEDLKKRVEEYNSRSSTPILFPIECMTYRNYAFIANGDFNFIQFCLVDSSGRETFHPEQAIDLFDSSVKEVKISEFSKLYKTLIETKAHASVLRMYIKAHSTQKHLVDKRVEKYDAEGASLLEEMGLDYAMRYAPKSEGKTKDETSDYIPFTELTAQLKGAASISASTSYKKYQAKGKPNIGDNICWEYFKKYDEQLSNLGTETFVEFSQKTLEGVEETVDFLSQKISSIKFFLMITNSWFSDIEKSDEFEYDGLVFKTKEVNEYL